MKLIKTANGKQTIKISKAEWESIGRDAGWMRTAGSISEWHQIAKNIVRRLEEESKEHYGEINAAYTLGALSFVFGHSLSAIEKAADKGYARQLEYPEIQQLIDKIVALKKASENSDVPGFEGTRESLEELSIRE
ncbi:MAG: hypothetical protein JSW62_00590 [Thermoplasmatales archaeon]|nr:MAG: hypothetical protein JSW62_00590 [Thermoplasmatales archaeon]